MFDNKKSCSNIIEKSSSFLSYYYGNSNLFSLDNMHIIRKLYLYFPIFNNYLETLNWDYYKVLLKLDKKECYFYYYIVLFCNSDLTDLYEMIENDYYLRI